MIMTKQSLIAAMLFVAWNAHAGDCSPGSPIYDDAFFKYCDDARAAQAEATQDTPDTARRRTTSGDEGKASAAVGPSGADAPAYTSTRAD
jgi:hypothetical protein